MPGSAYLNIDDAEFDFEPTDLLQTKYLIAGIALLDAARASSWPASLGYTVISLIAINYDADADATNDEEADEPESYGISVIKSALWQAVATTYTAYEEIKENLILHHCHLG